ncbi:glycosyltransferase family 1 protein [Pholiota molesta]|nr:glycosyltransferase family 1 protein [Pholiota molesta]
MFFFWVTVLAFLVICRIYMILPTQSGRPKRLRRKSDVCSVAVFLGSGGHTTEALTLLSALDPKRYTYRTYIVSEGDSLSVKKALQLEDQLGSTKQDYDILTIPRARQVHQPLITTPLGALKSLLTCLQYITLRPLFSPQKPADVLILNGPGTSFILCIAVYVNKFLGLHAPLIIYVETFARVNSLSLSGKLIRPLADRFLLQWPLAKGEAKLSPKHWLV